MKYCTLALVFLISCSLYGLELDDAIRKTLASNFKIKGEEYSLLADKEQYKQAVAPFLPTITATFSHDLEVSDFSKNNKSISVNQQLFGFGGNVSAYKKAKKLALISKIKFLQVKQELVLETVKSYTDVLEKAREKELHEHNVYTIEQQLGVEEERLKLGEITKIDVEKIRYNLSAARSEKIKSEGALSNAYEHYTRVVGTKAENLHEPKQHPSLPKSLQDAVNLALIHNLQLKSAKLAYESSKYSVAEASSKALPSVSANLNWSEDKDGKHTHSAMLVASVPLFQKGVDYLKIQQAKYLLAQSKENYYEAKKAVEEQVNIAWNTVITSKAFLESSNKEVESREMLLESKKKSKILHLSTSNDVLDEENSLLKAKKQMFSAKMQHLLAVYNLAILTSDIQKMF